MTDSDSLTDRTDSSKRAKGDRAAVPTDVVAIDGPSGAGKSTIARLLAQRLGYAFLDTGAMYRAITWHFLERGIAPSECGDEPDLGHARMQAALLDAELGFVAGNMLLNGRDITAHLRTREVESQVSAVSALPFVRASMGDLQRGVAMQGPVVAEGRDMGSVVFPGARWKVYLDAAPSERARRRCQDFERQGRKVSEVDVLDEIMVRDRLDSSRSDAPLKQADDALYLDTTGLTTAAVIQQLLALVQAGTSSNGCPGRSPSDTPTPDTSAPRETL
ncbi:MAG: cytidylate kinase [Planctomycetota bacterium]